MNSEATLLLYQKPTPCDVRLRSLMEFLGVPCKVLDISGLQPEFNRRPDHELCILASASTISRWCHNGTNNLARMDRLVQKSRYLFLYGFVPENDAIPVAERLTNGQVSGVRRFGRPGFKYEVASSRPELTKEFTGLSFGPIHNEVDFAFICQPLPGDIHPLISIAGLPFWLSSERTGCTLFLLACSDIADLQEHTGGNVDVVRYFSRLLPAVMFLKWAFKNHCWHSEHRFANFIIDDPLLKESYGHLNYEDLLRKMDKHNFSTTVAFIPWNYRRTQRKTARLFRDRPDKLALCVHGCDHTKGELGTTDIAVLNQSVQLASDRMDVHRARTGLEHAPVMVFPQGGFTSEALRVLECNNYIAAVNSNATPTSSTHELTLRDFLQPAVTRFGGVPLYLRRYPGPLERFAFDLFVDKPVLVVQHHGYLEDGGQRLIEFIAQLNSLGRLEWRGLREIVEKTYLRRDVSPHTSVCKLLSNSQIVENSSDHDHTFFITKAHSGEFLIDGVFVNGRPCDFTICDDIIEFPLEIPARTSATVNIAYRNDLPCAEPRHGFRSTTRVWTRRMLSEFRDNVIWKSDFLIAVARAVNRRFLGERLKSLSNTSTFGEGRV